VSASPYETFITTIEALHDADMSLIRVPLRSKNPNRAGWQRERHQAGDFRSAFSTVSNVGVLLGEPSNNLIDVDIDCAEAMLIASSMLPSTASRFGHGQTLESHWLYRVPQPIETRKFTDPLKGSTDKTAMLIEVRSTGTQTIIPPSVHPSGEAVTWAEQGEPALVDGAALLVIVSKIAAAALLVRYWPGEGSRHDAALALGGGLLRGGWEDRDAARFVGVIARAAGDDEVEDRVRAVMTTADALNDNRKATGWPTLKTLVDPRVVDAVMRWLEMGKEENGADDAPALTPYDPFPVHVFPPVIERFIVEGAMAMGVPVEFIAMPVLGFAAGLIGNLRVLQVKRSWSEPAILWTAVVSAPGSGKSPALSYAQQLVDSLQQSSWTSYQDEMRAWQANTQGGTLKERVLPKSASPQPKLKSYYTTDATLEAIAVMISLAPGLSVIRDELVGWVKSHDAYRASGDRQAWLQLWSGGSLKIDRKTTATIFVSHPAISVIGGIQPDRIADLRDDAATNDGFVDRVLIAWPDAFPPPWTEHDVDAEVVNRAVALFRQLRLDARGRDLVRTIVKMDAVARQHWIRWYDENRATIHDAKGLASGWAAKYPRQVLRIALVLHALHHPDDPDTTLSSAVIDGAIAIVECLRTHLNRVLKVIGQPASKPGHAGVLSRLHGILMRQGGEWISRSDLHQAFGGNTKGEVLTTALSQLEEEGVAEQRAVPTEGRPRVEWRWRRHERTNKGSANDGVRTTSFVSSFFRDEEEVAPRAAGPVDETTCSICKQPLEEARRYMCVGCAAEGVRLNELRFDAGKDDAA
jgi:hypothetical protein